jgi:bifunctional non-homologous end joining protein LigD
LSNRWSARQFQNLRDRPEWVREVKLDGDRAIAVSSGIKMSFFSRDRKSFNQEYSYILEALVGLPEGTVVNGKIVALDDSVYTPNSSR